MTSSLGAGVDPETIGRQLHECIADLYPICRSITGEGVRETLRRLQRVTPIAVHEVPSGSAAFDWTVPLEWNVRDAFVKNSKGERVIDFRRSNLHVVSYSVPVHRRMRLAELKPHLFTLPDQPRSIPYRTSYYEKSWGFCLSQDQLETLSDDEYEICIDSTLEAGSLTYGECRLAGTSTEEILLSCHICHPSLANDNLSGMAVAAYLAKQLAARPLRHSVRLLFVPGTIGSITWLSRNEAVIPNIRHGLVLCCLGDAGRMTYKKSRRGNAPVDRAAMHVLRGLDDYRVIEFSPYGYDERQFCSPGFDLPVGRLSRTPHGEFPEYHTSADDVGFVRPEKLAGAFLTCLAILDALDADRTYVGTNPKCEPQLGRRGLYHSIGGLPHSPENEMAMLWVLNLADGRHSLLDVAERSGLRFDAVKRAADALLDKSLLKEAS